MRFGHSRKTAGRRRWKMAVYKPRRQDSEDDLAETLIDRAYKVVVKIECDNICKVHIISSVVKWCSHSFLCVTCPVKPLTTAVWRKYLKFSLNGFHRACFERSYLRSTTLGCCHWVGLCVNHSCRETEWIKFPISLLPGLTSEFECMCMCVGVERETYRQYFGDGLWGCGVSFPT